MRANTSQEELPIKFFLLVFILCVPFWLFGGNPLPIPIRLPVSALAAINPLLAALILSYWQSGVNGAKELLKRAFDYKKIKDKTWYLPILFLNPLIAILAYAVMRMVGLPLPDQVNFPLLDALIFFLVFFIAGIFEELGWMGYAFDPMQNRWGALKASILLGLVWALIHLIPDIQNGQAFDFIFWQRLGGVALRVIMAWIYNNTGRSVFSSILFHTSNNLSWALFPNYGTHYDPFVFGVITILITLMIILRWEPKTLARYRHAL